MSIETYVKCDECEEKIGEAAPWMALLWADGERRDFCSRKCFVERAARFVRDAANDEKVETQIAAVA